MKLVGFDETTENVLGALAAADAQKAQAVITASLTTAANCIAFYKAAASLNIPQSKMIGQTDCTSYGASVTSQLPGGHYPEIWYQRGQPLDDLLLPYTQAGLNFKAVVTGMGGTLLDFENYAWVNEFAGMMTDDKFFNEIGYAGVAGPNSAALIEAKASAFRGPVAMGPPIIECGKYRLLRLTAPTAPSSSTTTAAPSTRPTPVRAARDRSRATSSPRPGWRSTTACCPASDAAGALERER